ncbi:MAG: DUF1003 domain-containing protein [Actinomycetia bacterium]|nr:DUF1003 domain-containing protein [Actinomycetes bacterium]
MAEDREATRGQDADFNTLNQPLDRSPTRLQYDPERFGRLSERVARYIGSWSFIAWMTAVILVWVLYNVFAPEEWKADPYPFLFMVLLLSLQASYAAPLILLAQNRQSDRDRVQYTEDRDRADRLLADTEYLMREIAALRTALGEVATRDFVRSELRDLLQDIEDDRDAGADVGDSTEQSGSSGPRSPRRTGRPPGRNQP